MLTFEPEFREQRFAQNTAKCPSSPVALHGVFGDRHEACVLTSPEDKDMEEAAVGFWPAATPNGVFYTRPR